MVLSWLSWAFLSAEVYACSVHPAASLRVTWKGQSQIPWDISPQTFLKYLGGGGTARGIPEEVTSRMVTAESDGGMERLASGADEAAWASDLTSKAEGVAEESLLSGSSELKAEKTK